MYVLKPISFFIDKSSSYDSELALTQLKRFLDRQNAYVTQFNIMTLLHRCGKHHIDVFSVCSSDVLFSALMVTSKQAASPQGKREGGSLKIFYVPNIGII